MKSYLQRNNNKYDANSQRKKKTKQKYCIKVTANLEFFTGKIYLKNGGKIRTFPEKQNLR